MSHGLMKPHYQSGYVTNSMDRALARFSEIYGITEWNRREPAQYLTLAGEPYTVTLAMGFAGDTCIELIEPMGGADGLYRHVLPENGEFTIRHHHIASLVHSEEEWNELEEAVRNGGIKPAWRIENDAARALYIDTFADLGHYIEYIFYK